MLTACWPCACRYKYDFGSWDMLARARLAVGVGAFANMADETAQETLAMAKLTAQATGTSKSKRGYCGGYCKAATAFILLRESATDASALALIKTFADGLRTTGRTAYLVCGHPPIVCCSPHCCPFLAVCR